MENSTTSKGKRLRKRNKACSVHNVVEMVTRRKIALRLRGFLDIYKKLKESKRKINVNFTDTLFEAVKQEVSVNTFESTLDIEKIIQNQFGK